MNLNLSHTLRRFCIEKKSENIVTDKTSLYKRILGLFRDKTFIKIFILFIVIKILIIAIAGSALYIPAQFTTQKQHIDNKFLNFFAQYDSSAYLDIAKNGYNAQFGEGIGNYSYFPLYPMLIKLFSYLFGFGWSAFLVSNVLSFIALFLMYLFIKEEFDRKIAGKAVFYLLLFPVAYFFTMMYTESLFFVLILLMFYYARRDRWALVGIFGFLASLTRMFGIIMILPMLYIYLNNRKFKKIDGKVFYLLLIPLGLFLLYSYFYVSTGDFLIAFKTFAKPEYAFKPLFPGLAFIYSFLDIFRTSDPSAIFYIIFNLVLGIFFVWMSVYSFKIRKEYGVFMIFYLILALAHTTLNANTRYFMLMFPAYIYLAQIKNKTAIKIVTAIFILFFLLMLLFTLRHVNDTINFGAYAGFLKSVILH